MHSSEIAADTLSLGAYLRGLRTAQNASLQRLARQAGISARTLSYWEAGTYKPCVPELDAALTALRATTSERTQAMLLLGAPRARRYFGDQSDSLPSGGDLLRALRLRDGLHLEQVATRVGVSAATLSRWESGKLVPNADLLPSLLAALGAHPEERAFLTSGFPGGLYLRPASGAAASVEALEADFERFKAVVADCEKDDLRDLRFLTFEAQAGNLAHASEAGRHLLAEIYACHASFLGAFSRFGEISRYANRAIVLSSKPIRPSRPSHTLLRAAISLAQASVYGGGSDAKPKPMRGAAILARWEGQANALEATNPAHAAWMLADEALYLSMGGHHEAALALILRSCRVAEGANPVESGLRQLDRARILMAVGRAEEALTVLPSFKQQAPYWRTKVNLLWTEGLLQLEQKSEAQMWLERAFLDIRDHRLEHLRSRADALAVRF